MGECRTGESRTRVVVDVGELWTWGSCGRGGVASVVGVAVWGSHGVGELWPVGVTVCGSHYVWE